MSLQQRGKWKPNQQNQIVIEALVLTKDENSPSLKWPLGRIVQLHAVAVGVVRVANVKANNGIITHTVAKLCALSINIIG
ncbi:hypothetical protein NQ314_018996 [Rhamnusium bicolor]|uniref:DUF5641 domain-containing protein n=1 Tax=Rhamnusium bicolor TaxID=1586634 RepID=A0AAV8WQI1_9CUCU|nr:hypothetical protein NQ314_018996 [Rhamnusium bicolor]